MTKRYKLTIEYDGTNYCGFQKQKDLATKSIEGALEDAIFEMSKQRVKIVPCGRTDAGVHALSQVVHFDLDKEFEPFKMITGLNFYLRDEEISVLNCEKTDEKFHARLSTKMRSYRYIIINRGSKLALEKNHAHQVIKNLDEKLMQEAANFLIGKHDFSAFRDAECQGKTPIKTMQSIKIFRQNDRIILEFYAKSFLHHMVRNIVGTLIWVGNKKITPKKVKEILNSKDRTKSGPNAPACGLYFLNCEY